MSKELDRLYDSQPPEGGAVILFMVLSVVFFLGALVGAGIALLFM